MQNKEIIYFGKNAIEEAPQLIKAGLISLIYQKGNIRYIKVGDLEVLRMIYPAVRDHNWGTLNYSIENERIDISEKSFQISYTAIYGEPGIFKACYEITGNADDGIIFKMEGAALKDFSTNRIGLCVLHPIETSVNKPCSIETTKGEVYNSVFPLKIAPNQPFKNIKKMFWMPEVDLQVELEFEGDTFETEDHRNWTDDSFKTYSRPLELQFPFKMHMGERIEQKVHLHILNQGNLQDSGNKGLKFYFDLSDNAFIEMPVIGVSKSSEEMELDHSDFSDIARIAFNHYRIEVKFSDKEWVKDFINGCNEAQILKILPELVLFFKSDFLNETNDLIQLIKSLQIDIYSILLLDEKVKITEENISNTVYRMLKGNFPMTKIGVGTDANFAELNRSRISENNADFVSFSICPQVHASDNLSLIENIRAQKYTIHSCQKKFESLHVHVSPVTLKPRFNAVATSSEVDHKPEGLPSTVDYRQPSLFAAGWTMGSIKTMAEAGAKSITYYETIGSRGIIQGKQVNPFPELFFSRPGRIFPMYYVFSFLLKKNTRIIKSISSNQLEFDGIVLKRDGKIEILIANYTSKKIKIELENLSKECKILKLDENNFEKYSGSVTSLDEEAVKLTSRTIDLNPFGLGFIFH
ncbi:MAG: hypothetical protein P1P88_13980 [Bacteroidales bacterium]|nr:hypothetical protein [Bacteroidales bacterium]